MIYKKLFLVLIIIVGLLFSLFVYSQASLKTNIISISPIYDKPKIPIFKTPPVLENYCSGSICLPPGETPVSLNFNRLSKLSAREFETTTIENKIGTASVVGTYDIPVLMVEFPDLQEPSNYTQSIYDDVFNSSNYLSGEGISVKEFYKHNSYDQLAVSYDVYDWRMMPQNYAYYVANTHQLVVDALNIFGTGSNPIDFTQYDYNNDGTLDGVIILHAGYQAQEQPGHIISQARIYKDSTTWTIQGLYYGDAAIIPAKHVNTGLCNNWIANFNYPTDCRTSPQIAIHEFGHVLGIPDLYAISYDGIQSGFGLGGHTVMVLNGDTIQDVKKPVNFDSWSKYFFGWLTPTVINDTSQADIYSLSAYDTSNDAYILRNPSTMGSREFYIIVNRYISDTSLDLYLFGVVPPVFNIHGGLDILHVDEQYIDETYAGPTAFNSIMYDIDGDYYDDNISHPGIVFEQNRLDQALTRHYSDDYTNEDYIFNPNCNPIINVGKFDDISRIDPNPDCGVTRDTTSSSYQTLQNSGIKVYGWSPSGSTVEGYFTVDTPLDLVATITSPDEGDSYGLDDSIDFESDIQNPIGDSSCTWEHKLSGNSTYTTFSSSCDFSETPLSIGLTEGTYTIQLTVEDELDRTSIDSVEIDIVISTTLYNQILSPVENQSYPYKELVDFNAVYFNNQGDVSCEWKSDGQVISNECNFSENPYNLGLTSKALNIITENISPFFVNNNSPIISSLFTKNPINNLVKNSVIDSPFLSLNLSNRIQIAQYHHKTITLTTIDDVTSYTTSMVMKVCMCVTVHKHINAD